jgi:hypothetical protein
MAHDKVSGYRFGVMRVRSKRNVGDKKMTAQSQQQKEGVTNRQSKAGGNVRDTDGMGWMELADYRQ